MLVLVLVAAAALLALVVTIGGLQRAVANDHALAGHYGFMAAFGLTVLGLGLLAALRPVGWRLVAWLTGLLPALLGLASLVYPNIASSRPGLGGGGHRVVGRVRGRSRDDAGEG